MEYDIYKMHSHNFHFSKLIPSAGWIQLIINLFIHHEKYRGTDSSRMSPHGIILRSMTICYDIHGSTQHEDLCEEFLKNKETSNIKYLKISLI